MDWMPASGETLLVCETIRFATGVAPLVESRRWFRDTNRRDIQHELPGWPEGPTFTLSSDGEQAANAATNGLLAVLPVVGNILSQLGGGGSPYGKGGPSKPGGESRDPDNEVHDFPVMWAAPGTIARTLPWQLDPARSPRRRMKEFHTEAALTDRRLLILGSWPGESRTALWEVPREYVAGAQVMEFSIGGHDIRISFTDQSWVRLTTRHSTRMANFLNGRSRVLAESELTPGQRQRAAEFAARCKVKTRPMFTRLPSGVVLGEIHDPKGGTFPFFMDGDGKRAASQPGDL